MSQKIVSQLDAVGVFIGATVADADPLEPGSFLVPGGAVDAAPPEVPPGHVARWVGDWVFEIIPVVAEPPSEQPTPEQIIQQFTDAIQLRLDTFARTRNYDGILSACTYATSTVPKFQVEGQYCVNARDATWAAAYEILAEVQAGTHPMPNSISDIETELPVLVWPS